MTATATSRSPSEVVVGHGAAVGVQLADVGDAHALTGVGEARHVPLRRALLEYLRHLGVFREIRKRHVAVDGHEIEIGVGSRSAHVTPQPDPENRSGPKVSRSSVKAGTGGPSRAPEHAVALTSEVRHEEIGTRIPVVVAAGDAHACPRVGHVRRGRDFLQAEAEVRRIGLGPMRPGDVLVEAIGLGSFAR